MNSWQKRILDLQQTGLTQAAIAEKIGLSASGVGDIAQGRTKSPSGDAALALDKLHREMCPTEAA